MEMIQMLSVDLKNRFVKDFSLPIKVFQEPYFSYYLELYDETHQTKRKYNMFKDAVERNGGERGFMDYYNQLKDKVSNTIKQTNAFDVFNHDRLEEYDVQKHSFSKQNIYQKENVGKVFVSVDLKTANFQALKWYDKSLVLGMDSYEDLMKVFTDEKYFIQSKYLRQVIFGNLNPKKQVKIEEYLTYAVLQLFLQEGVCKEEDVRMFSKDEFVFEIPKEKAMNFNGSATESFIGDCFENNILTKVTVFELVPAGKYFAKRFVEYAMGYSNEYEFICVPNIEFPQIYKDFYNMPLNDKDLVFYHEGRLATFLEPNRSNEQSA
ncbi:hypothetical protein P9035_18850 [Bacillus thuringiensis]|nr:hypothetical protein [Bacillus thuringiensis]EEM25100.1 hypothetical protein bthur0002_57420 [Bacillus thuringiensis Bt407]MEC3071489.1 hypothetical protein [Bacillus cereus]PQZ77809.1 hypothetical protein CQ064_08125 [Bacillus sp. MYb78]MBN6707714.1 hypothetical protein [Bacillus thuringiensis]MDV6355587.1 hypothetical protein [Bacillus thuringiensis]